MMIASQKQSIFFALILILTVFSSCGDDEEGTGIEGTYQLTVFQVEFSGTLIDFVPLGATLNLTLNSDGTTAGNLFVPVSGLNAELDEGLPLNANLLGTWTQTGQNVMFNQEADTFIRDEAWIVQGDTLRLELIDAEEGNFFLVILTR